MLDVIFFGELTNQGEVELLHCWTHDQLADIITKALKLEVFLKLGRRLRMCNFGEVNLLYLFE